MPYGFVQETWCFRQADWLEWWFVWIVNLSATRITWEMGLRPCLWGVILTVWREVKRSAYCDRVTLFPQLEFELSKGRKGTKYAGGIHKPSVLSVSGCGYGVTGCFKIPVVLTIYYRWLAILDLRAKVNPLPLSYFCQSVLSQHRRESKTQGFGWKRLWNRTQKGIPSRNCTLPQPGGEWSQGDCHYHEARGLHWFDWWLYLRKMLWKL